MRKCSWIVEEEEVSKVSLPPTLSNAL